MQSLIQESRIESRLAGNGWPRELVSGLVSVVMPAYNCAGSLAASVDSVRQQTYGQWELIVVDDGSRDTTVDVAQRLAAQDARIRVLVQKENQGAAGARNAGIEAARGQYLAFLDSDDLWLPHKLAVQVDFLRSRDAGFCFASYRRWNGAGELGALVPVPEKVRYRDLLGGNVIACLTVLIDRERIAPFRMPAISHEDYAAWLAILRTGEVAYGIPVDVARYRVSSESLSGNKLRSALWTWQILRRQEMLPLPRAAWFFLRYAARAVSIRGGRRGRLAEPGWEMGDV